MYYICTTTKEYLGLADSKYREEICQNLKSNQWKCRLSQIKRDSLGSRNGDSLTAGRVSVWLMSQRHTCVTVISWPHHHHTTHHARRPAGNLPVQGPIDGSRHTNNPLIRPGLASKKQLMLDVTSSRTSGQVGRWPATAPPRPGMLRSCGWDRTVVEQLFVFLSVVIHKDLLSNRCYLHGQ